MAMRALCAPSMREPKRRKASSALALIVLCALVRTVVQEDTHLEWYQVIEEPRQGDLISSMPLHASTTIIGWGLQELHIDGVKVWEHRIDSADGRTGGSSRKISLMPRWEDDALFLSGQHTISLHVGLSLPGSRVQLAGEVNYTLSLPPEPPEDWRGPFTVMVVGDFIPWDRPADSHAGRVAAGLEGAGAFVHRVQETQMAERMLVYTVLVSLPDLLLYVPSARGTLDWNSTGAAAPAACKAAHDSRIPSALWITEPHVGQPLSPHALPSWAAECAYVVTPAGVPPRAAAGRHLWAPPFHTAAPAGPSSAAPPPLAGLSVPVVMVGANSRQEHFEGGGAGAGAGAGACGPGWGLRARVARALQAPPPPFVLIGHAAFFTPY